VTAVCEEGTLRADYARRRWSWAGKDGVWTHEAVSVPDGDEVYRIQNAAFLEAVEGNGRVVCSLEDAVRTLRVNMASHRSVVEASWQQVLV
jgi:predicted dehydrogenase